MPLLPTERLQRVMRRPRGKPTMEAMLLLLLLWQRQRQECMGVVTMEGGEKGSWGGVSQRVNEEGDSVGSPLWHLARVMRRSWYSCRKVSYSVHC